MHFFFFLKDQKRVLSFWLFLVCVIGLLLSIMRFNDSQKKSPHRVLQSYTMMELSDQGDEAASSSV